MKIFTYRTLSSAVMALAIPVMFSCAGLGGGSGRYSDDPSVAAQQSRIEALRMEAREAENYRKEAEERERAAKSRLRAAEHELKALQSEAERRRSYQ